MNAPLPNPKVDYRTDPSHYHHVKLSFDGAVATLAIDIDEDAGIRPGYKLKLNSYDLGVDIELHDALQRIRFEHPEVKAVIVTSAKDKVFCSGANIFMLGVSSHAWKVNFCKFTNETRNGIEDSSTHSGLKFIAAVNGACAGGGYVFFLLMPITWAALAFRPEQLDPNLLQVANDYVWFVFILSWPPFAVFMLMIAAAVLRDHNPTPIFPRWVGYLNLWTAVLIVPAGLIEFFKTGPFAYNGEVSFWFVWIVFFGWIIGMTAIVLRACTAEKKRQLAEASLGGEASDRQVQPA